VYSLRQRNDSPGARPFVVQAPSTDSVVRTETQVALRGPLFVTVWLSRTVSPALTRPSPCTWITWDVVTKSKSLADMVSDSEKRATVSENVTASPKKVVRVTIAEIAPSSISSCVISWLPRHKSACGDPSSVFAGTVPLQSVSMITPTSLATRTPFAVTEPRLNTSSCRTTVSPTSTVTPRSVNAVRVASRLVVRGRA